MSKKLKSLLVVFNNNTVAPLYINELGLPLKFCGCTTVNGLLLGVNADVYTAIPFTILKLLM